MAHVDSISIHRAEDCVARATCNEGTCWLSLEFSEDDGERVRRFRVSVFMDIARAHRLADAINAAWPEPEADRDRNMPPRYERGSNGPWPRPSSHRQAEGMRCEDMLPGYGDDGDEAA